MPDRSERRAISAMPNRRQRRAAVPLGILAALLVSAPISAADHARPKVVSMVPVQGSIRAQPWTSIVLRFSEPVASAAGATLTRVGSAGAVAASISLASDGRRLTIDPTADLDIGARYRVRLPGTIRDRAGNALAAWSATFAVTSEPAAHHGPHFSYRKDLPVSAWHVPQDELPFAATMGVSIVVKKFTADDDPVAYLDAAAMIGVRVLAGFDYIYQDGTPDLAAAAAIASRLRGHPGLYGFLAATEPEAYDLSGGELRDLYRAYKSADPSRKVMLSLGNLRSFPAWAPRHLGPGMADAVICEWYPVVMRSPANPDGWTSGSAAILTAFRAALDRVAPRMPVWGSIAVHTYLPGARRSPSLAEMADEARDQFRYVGAVGLSVYPWHTGTYQNDLRRDLRRQSWFTELINAVRAGTL
jgi:methionine-rich copper-binding protein CopC